MYLLDTNAVSNYLGGNRSDEKLRQRILSVDDAELFISVITAEELLRGALGLINSARSGNPPQPERVISAYELFSGLLEDLRQFAILPYDRTAEVEFQRVESGVRRRHAQDSGIAAIAAARKLTVITANLRDFQSIGIAPCEDWTR